MTVYDGPSTDDPVLVRLCGGGAVPDIIGSDVNMLLEFHTSPYDNPFHPVILTSLPGFELDVKVTNFLYRYVSFFIYSQFSSQLIDVIRNQTGV